MTICERLQRITPILSIIAKYTIIPDEIILMCHRGYVDLYKLIEDDTQHPDWKLCIEFALNCSSYYIVKSFLKHHVIDDLVMLKLAIQCRSVDIINTMLKYIKNVSILRIHAQEHMHKSDITVEFIEWFHAKYWLNYHDFYVLSENREIKDSIYVLLRAYELMQHKPSIPYVDILERAINVKDPLILRRTHRLLTNSYNDKIYSGWFNNLLQNVNPNAKLFFEAVPELCRPNKYQYLGGIRTAYQLAIDAYLYHQHKEPYKEPIVPLTSLKL